MNYACLKNRDDSAVPSRLRSLWNIMKPFRADLFMNIGQFSGICKILQDMHSNLISSCCIEKEIVAVEYMSSLENDLIELELTTSLATVRKMQDAYADNNSTLSHIISLQLELQGRLVDEMGGKFYCALNIMEAELYSNPRNGWEKIMGIIRLTP